MADVFISYSRKDQDFVRRLHGALKEQNRDVWVDWEGIAPSVEWMQEIHSAIDSADIFVFVLSPDSIVSEICRKEIEHAVANNKRLVPIVYRDVKASDVPGKAAAHNWIFCREGDDFQAAFQTLMKAIITLTDF